MGVRHPCCESCVDSCSAQGVSDWSSVVCRHRQAPSHTKEANYIQAQIESLRTTRTLLFPGEVCVTLSKGRTRHCVQGAMARGSIVSSLPIPLPPVDGQSQIFSEVAEHLSILDQAGVTIDTNLKRAARLRQGILKRAFEGKLVPQDPNDEPATNLLERIKTARPIPELKGKRRNTPRRRR